MGWGGLMREGKRRRWRGGVRVRGQTLEFTAGLTHRSEESEEAGRKVRVGLGEGWGVGKGVRGEVGGARYRAEGGRGQGEGEDHGGRADAGWEK